MFDGVPADQFHQFLAASSRASLPIPLSFSHLHHHHHHGVSVPIPSSVPATPGPVIASTPTPGPAPGFLGCFDLYPSNQILEVVQQPPPDHHNHHSGLHLGQLHHRQSPSPPSDIIKNGICEERNMLPMEEEEDRRRRPISVITIPPPSQPPAATADAGAVAYDDIPWSNDEVLTLLRIRSGMENWFPEFTWEHVSRKLEEHGYQRSADKCKEKFEEESRHFNRMSYHKNYRFFSDLDELYSDDHDQRNHPQPKVSNEKDQDLEKGEDLHHHEEPEIQEEEKEEEEDKMNLSHPQEEAEETENAVTPSNPCHQEGNNTASLVKETTRSISKRKRKRKYKFEMFKGFCQSVVKRIVDQQEDLHNKLIEDMIKREEECSAREEAWKCQEMERFNKEIEMRAQEQVNAGDRQAKIIDLLKEFATTSGTAHHEQDQNLTRKIEDIFKVRNNGSSSSTSVTTISSENFSLHQNPTPILLPPAISSSETTPSPQNHYSTTTQQQEATTTSVLAITSKSLKENSHSLALARKSSRKSTEKGEKDAGKRWPSDEVQALINLKCSQTNNNGTTDHDREAKGPLWERISQGMLELGYERSAKRCKEKWENINKYFRKTKDSNKKRSAESRTCPYFHQLSTLYSQQQQQQQQQGTTLTNDDDNSNNKAIAPNSSDDHHVLDKENCPNSPQKKLAN